MEKPLVTIIVAASENNVIGKDNNLLWHLPNDLKFFKQTTLGRPLVMGRKTFESLDGPLPKRRNIVVTRQSAYSAEGVEVAHSIEEALAGCAGEEEVFIGGGAEIYKQALPLVDRIYLTRVHTVVEGDSYFVELGDEWQLLSADSHAADGRHAFGYTFLTYERTAQK